MYNMYIIYDHNIKIFITYLDYCEYIIDISPREKERTIHGILVYTQLHDSCHFVVFSFLLGLKESFELDKGRF